MDNVWRTGMWDSVDTAALLCAVACAVCAVACLGAWWLWRLSRRGPASNVWDELESGLESVSGVWYTDESSHTGDLVFLRTACTGAVTVGMVVMHSETGEPWLVEAAGGRVTALPLRDRLDEHEGVTIIVAIARPLSATDVRRSMVSVRDTTVTDDDGSVFVTGVLSRLGVVEDKTACAHGLLRAAVMCGKYYAPFRLA